MSSHTPVYDRTNRGTSLKDASFTKVWAEIAALKERISILEQTKNKKGAKYDESNDAGK